MVKMMGFGLVAFLFLQGTGRPQSQQTAPPDNQPRRLARCDQEKVLYSPFDVTYSKRIVWQRVTQTENPPVGPKKQYSPERTKWSVTVEPDTTKPGPWNTIIYYGSDANEEVWKLALNDNIGTDFKWLNEKLVFGTVWWGRIYATEFILDLDNHKFLYKEMAHYGGMVEPCE